MINLKWEHFDRDRKVINILQGKGGKDRQVMLPDSLVPLLEEYAKECGKLSPKDYVLKGQSCSQYSSRSVGEVIKQLAGKAGLNKHVYTHLIRHCTFTHMVENGTDINLIQRLAGHASVKTTSIYTHISHNLISKIQSPIEGINLGS